MYSPMLVKPYAHLVFCPPSPVPILQVILVPRVFKDSFFIVFFTVLCQPTSFIILNVFGPPEGGPILFLLSPEVSRTSGTMSIYIYIYVYIYYIYIYVNNMADAKSVRNLLAIFR